MEILGFEPKAFPMRKGRSTTELYPLHSSLICVPQFKLFSLGFLDKVLKNDEIKMEILGFEPKAFPMRTGLSTTELHPLHSVLICVPQFKLFSLGFLDKVLKNG
jgi:hypothetical protein